MNQVKHVIKSSLGFLPGGASILEAYREQILQRQLHKSGGVDVVFESIFKSNYWECPESVSEDGSTLMYTRNIRKKIPQLFDLLCFKKILDAPCGDFNWFREVKFQSEIDYTGADIVADIVLQNNAKYSNQRTRFVKLDIVKDSLPDADLMICRDCLFHLAQKDIFCFINNFLASRIPFLLTSTYPACTLNTHIVTGSFRLLNLCLPPYNLEKPILAIDDWISGHPERHLALWHRSAFLRAPLLAKSKAYRISKIFFGCVFRFQGA